MLLVSLTFRDLASKINAMKLSFKRWEDFKIILPQAKNTGFPSNQRRIKKVSIERSHNVLEY